MASWQDFSCGSNTTTRTEGRPIIEGLAGGCRQRQPADLRNVIWIVLQTHQFRARSHRPMSTARWERLNDLYHTAVALADDEHVVLRFFTHRPKLSR